MADSDELDIGNEVLIERVDKFCCVGDNVACKWRPQFGSDNKDENHTTTTPQLFYSPFYRTIRPVGEPEPEENFWTLWCKGRLTEADTPTIWLGATSSAHLHHGKSFPTTCLY